MTEQIDTLIVGNRFERLLQREQLGRRETDRVVARRGARTGGGQTRAAPYTLDPFFSVLHVRNLELPVRH